MTIAAASRSRIATIAESSYGVTPASPAFTTLRRASGGLRSNKQLAPTVFDLANDRRAVESVLLGQDVSGSYGFEFSADTLDALILAPALCGAWSSNVLKDGVLNQSLTFEETVAVGAGYTFRRFVGCRIDSLALEFSARSPVTAQAAIIGSRETLDTAIISGATYSSPTTSKIETTNSVASLAVAGLSPAPIVRRLSLQIANGLQQLHTVASLYGQDSGLGAMSVTGSFEAYFSSNALYQAVLDHGGGALTWTFGATSGKRYTLSMPTVRFLDGAVVLGGKQDDLICSVPFQALKDASLGAMLSITRGVT